MHQRLTVAVSAVQLGNSSGTVLASGRALRQHRRLLLQRCCWASPCRQKLLRRLHAMITLHADYACLHADSPCSTMLAALLCIALSARAFQAASSSYTSRPPPSEAQFIVGHGSNDMPDSGAGSPPSSNHRQVLDQPNVRLRYNESSSSPCAMPLACPAGPASVLAVDAVFRASEAKTWRTHFVIV